MLKDKEQIRANVLVENERVNVVRKTNVYYIFDNLTKSVVNTSRYTYHFDISMVKRSFSSRFGSIYGSYDNYRKLGGTRYEIIALDLASDDILEVLKKL